MSMFQWLLNLHDIFAHTFMGVIPNPNELNLKWRKEPQPTTILTSVHHNSTANYPFTYFLSENSKQRLPWLLKDTLIIHHRKKSLASLTQNVQLLRIRKLVFHVSHEAGHAVQYFTIILCVERVIVRLKNRDKNKQ